MIKTIANKQVMVGADFAGFEPKGTVKKHLIVRGQEVADLTPVKTESGMYHRVGFALGSKIIEDEFEWALAFCGTGMGIHVAASKVPHVHAVVAESVRAARRAAAANSCSLLAMGEFWIDHRLGMAMANTFLENHLDSSYEDWEGFLEYHQIGFNGCEHSNHEVCRISGFQVVNPATTVLGPEPGGLIH